jgi:hypothetical protein
MAYTDYAMKHSITGLWTGFWTKALFGNSWVQKEKLQRRIHTSSSARWGFKMTARNFDQTAHNWQLLACVTSCGTSNNQPTDRHFARWTCITANILFQLWPLVSMFVIYLRFFTTTHNIPSVYIFGRFEVLRNGVTLVDLPGHGDTNNERCVHLNLIHFAKTGLNLAR